MRIRVIEVEYRFFKSNKYNVLRDEEFDIQFIPMKGDVIFIDDIRYRVEQRDFVDLKSQFIRLFVTKIYL